MKYLLLIYSPESSWTESERAHCLAASSAIYGELAQQGKCLAASPLHPVATATTVRVRAGQPVVTAGPFAETTEQLGGFYLLDVASLDEALAIAQQLPPARKGTVEIRPLFPLDGLPTEQLAPGQPLGPAELPAYMFLCYDDEAAWNKAGPAALRDAMLEAVALTHEIAARGRYLSASPLQPVATAVSVRVRNGRTLVTDGPFAETQEVLGGYYLILADNQSEAVHLAARHSGARVGAVEVREVFRLPAAPGSPTPRS